MGMFAEKPKEKSAEERYWDSISKSVAEEYRRRAIEVYGEKCLTDKYKTEDLANAIKKEREFVIGLLDKCTEWSKEKDPIVLFDIDDTIGKRSTTDGKWRFRPSFLGVLQYAQENFQNLKFGLVSNRTETAQMIQNGGELSPLEKYVDANHIYRLVDCRIQLNSLDYDDTAKKVWGLLDGHASHDEVRKYAMVNDLRESGLNVMLVDDCDAPRCFGANGFCVKQMMPYV